MKSVNVKGLVATSMMVALAAGAMMLVGTQKAEAQQWAVGVQYGHPGYYAAPSYGYGRDYYRDRAEFRERQTREEFREREAREAFARRQAFVRHEEWEHAGHFDR